MTEEQFTQLIELGHELENTIGWLFWGLLAIAFSLLQDNFKSYSIVKTECPHCRADKDKKSDGQN